METNSGKGAGLVVLSTTGSGSTAAGMVIWVWFQIISSILVDTQFSIWYIETLGGYWWILKLQDPIFVRCAPDFSATAMCESNALAMPLLGYLWCYHWDNLSIVLLAFFLGSHRGGFDSCYRGSPDGKNAPSSNPHFFPTILCPHGAICWFRGQVLPSTKTGLSKNKIFHPIPI